MIRQEIPDEAWEWLEPLLPDRTPQRGGRWRDHRTVLEGIVWRFRTGSPWRDLPDHYGPWQTVYDRFNRWSGDGTWDRLLARAPRRRVLVVTHASPIKAMVCDALGAPASAAWRLDSAPAAVTVVRWWADGGAERE